MLYLVLTESKPEYDYRTRKIADSLFPGYTFGRVGGRWHGVDESTVALLITTDDRAKVDKLAALVAAVNDQEAVMVITFGDARVELRGPLTIAERV